MRTPTIRTLEVFEPFDTADALIAHLRAQTSIPAILPRIGPKGQRLLPGDAGYDAMSSPEAQGKWPGMETRVRLAFEGMTIDLNNTDPLY